MESALKTDMPEDQSVKQTVLLATDNLNEAQDVAKSLTDIGYKVIFSEFDGERLRATPVHPPQAILILFTDYIEKTPAIIHALKKHYAPFAPPVVGALTRAGTVDTKIFDSVIFPPAHISQIANRVSSMIRLGEMEREITRRIATVKQDFGQDYTVSDKALRKPFRILFVGKATPDFMIIINALQNKNVEVIAAFTSFSAFDFLHERKFDAVVMNALEHSEPALTISDTMRRNSKLFHVPTLLLVDPDTFTDHDLAYKKGARDIISGKSPSEVIAGRILELANYHRIHDQLKHEFSVIGGEACLDKETGVFNEDFFAAHLRRVCIELKQTNTPLTLMAIRPLPNAHFPIAPVRIRAAVTQIGSMLRNLVRMQDIAARLQDDIFIIAFPGQSGLSLQPIIDRITGIVNCAAFESGNAEEGPFTVILETAIVEHMDHDNSDILIGSVVAEITGEPLRIFRTTT